VAASFLKLQKHVSQPFKRDFVVVLLFEGLADLVILAIYAPEVAQAEEDVAGAVRSYQDGLFAEVGSIGGNNRQ